MELKEFGQKNISRKKNGFRADMDVVRKQIIKRRVGILIAVCAVVAVIVISLIIDANKFDIWKYVTVEYTGADGYASPTFKVDTQGLYKAIVGNKSNSEKEYNAKMLIASIVIETDACDLKNGEKYKVKLTFNDKYEDAVGISFGSGKKTIKATGIESGTKIELFQNVDVLFAGISPEAYVVVTNNWEEEYLNSLTFEVDKDKNVEYGDTITVSCNQSFEDIARHGFIADELEMSFTADKLPGYVTDVSDIDKEVLSEVKNETIATMISETVDTTFHMLYKASKDTDVLYHRNNETCTGAKVLNTYFLTKKTEDVVYNNYIYIVTCGFVSDSEDGRMVYFVFEYTNNYINTDGTFDMIHDNASKRYKCSTDLDEIYNECIGSKSDSYNIKEIK